jgi:polyhydroxyalkanoic acid synthase PhaR subunit
MTTAAPQLPLTWKDLYDRTEEFWTKPLQTLLATDSMNQLFSLTRESTLTQTEASREAIERSLEALRLPSKADHARLAAQVVQLESKVEGLEDRLDAMNQKLDTVIGLLTAQAALETVEQAETGKRRSAAK